MIQTVLGEKKKWPPAMVALGTMLVTALFWAILPASLQNIERSDYTHFYEPAARNLLAGKGYLLSYPPGYTLILAGIFWLSGLLHIPESAALHILTLSCMSAAAVLIFVMARSLWEEFPSALAPLAWMTYPGNLWLTQQGSTEIPFLPVFYGSFTVLWRALLRDEERCPVYFLCGLLAGAAMLIRPIAIGTGGVMGAAVLLVCNKPMRVRLTLAAMLLAGNLAAILPWQWWVYAHTGQIVVLSKIAPVGMRDGFAFAAPKKYRVPAQVPKDIEILMQDIVIHRNELDSTLKVARKLLEHARIRPLAVLELCGMKIVRSWYGTDSGRFETGILAFQIVYLALTLWGAWSAWKLGGAAKRQAAVIGLMILYFWAMTALNLSILRYMVPAFGLAFILLPAVLSQKARTP